MDIDFEVYVLEQAVLLVKSMIENKYPTSLDHDLELLDSLYADEVEVENQWRFKLALIHRVNQKEILHNQL